MNGTVQGTVQDSEENLSYVQFFLSGTFRCDAEKPEYRRQYNYTEFAVFIYIYSGTFSENN
jgi:hypothetical protein